MKPLPTKTSATRRTFQPPFTPFPLPAETTPTFDLSGRKSGSGLRLVLIEAFSSELAFESQVDSTVTGHHSGR